ncbi:MAG: propionyl-CoA synthetase [Gammaproteobacteria bacterium]|nr:MAG: propionyl-CoA synthetase [Gammaproteobacteria bacterium]
MTYKEEYQNSLQNSIRFWQEKSADLPWYQKPSEVALKDDGGIHHWFADSKMNTCYMAVDYHCENGRSSQDALIYDSAVSGKSTRYTYGELKQEVAKTAGMLVELGVKKGDRVVLYMPMIAESAIAMLACSRIGAVHCVVFGGFAAPELASRIDDCTPVIILSASCGVEVNKIIPYKPILDNALKLSSHQPLKSVVLVRDELEDMPVPEMVDGFDVDWHSLKTIAKPVDCVPVRGDDLLYILYTSGTTGKPKGVTRESGGHAVAMKYSMKAIYDMNPGDVFWAASDVGWVVGHSYIVYAPLLQGCTSIFYEGKPIMTPDAGSFWRIIEDYKVKALFTAPTAFRAIKKEDPDGKLIKKYNISSLEKIFAAGERLDPPTYDWLVEKTGKPVFDHWWQTETGWAIVANMTGIEEMPVKPGSSTVPTPGFDIRILDDKGVELPTGEQGNICIKLPLPPSCLTKIYGDDNRFYNEYLSRFKGYYSSGDGGYFDEDGYLFIMGRTDDVINISGHRLSTGEMEEIVAKHKSVAECAVVGINDKLKGQIPLGFVVLKAGENITYQKLMHDLVQMVRSDIGAVACYKKTIIVKRLPKTRSGKILRKTMRQMVDGDEYIVPSTIDDPAIINEIELKIRAV